MGALLSVLAIASATGLAGWYAVRTRARRPPIAPSTDQRLDPGDVAEIEARWGAIETDHRRRRDDVLIARLRPLVAKRVPVRVVEALPELHAVRIRFADGTAVVGRGESPGDAGLLAARVNAQSVLAGACSSDLTGTHVVFDWAGGREHVSMLVTGLDQPD